MDDVPLDERPPFNLAATRLTLTIIPLIFMIIGLIVLDGVSNINNISFPLLFQQF